MAANAHVKSTFLAWTPGKQTEAERKSQLYRRHQHASIVNHQKKKVATVPFRPLIACAPPRQPGQSPSRSLTRHSSRSPVASAEEELQSRLFNFSLTPTVHPIDPTRVDPFDSLCVHGLSKAAQNMLQTAIVDQWPSFALSSQPQDIEQWKSITMKLGIASPPLLQALIYSGATYQSFNSSKDPSLEVIRITSYLEATRLLHKAIQTPDSCSEADLLAIAVLSLSGAPDFDEGQNPERKAHLSQTHPIIRDNDFFTRGYMEQIHRRAVVALAKHRGGLKTVQHTNVASMVTLLDVLDAFSNLRRPNFPLFISADPYLDHLTSRSGTMNGRNSDQLDDGFSFLRNSKYGRALLILLKRARAITDTYDTFLRDPNSGIDFTKFVVARRMIQHQALSSAAAQNILFNLCRLSLLAFLIESIIPLPRICEYHEFTSNKLMLVIDECDKLHYWESYHDLMIWATVLGGFTARASPLRWWFAEQLRGSTIPRTSESWDEVQRISERFLPFRYEQGQGCRAFWDAACMWLADSGR